MWAAEIIAKETINIVVDSKLGNPSLKALVELQNALDTRVIESLRCRTLTEDGSQIVVGIAGTSELLDRLLAQHRIQLPKQAESLCIQRPPGDTAQFYAIRSWKPTPRWRSETWDDSIPGFVEDAVAGRLSGKTTPLEVSQRLRDLAANTLSKIQQARDKLVVSSERGPASPTPGERVSAKPAHTISAEFRATELDLRVLGSLGTYHAEKKLAATELAFFDLTHETGRLARALPHARGSAAACEEIVRLTEGTYHSNLVFGFSPHHGRKNGHHHSGHWKDRLAEVREDVTVLEKRVAEHPDAKPPQRFPGEQPAGPVPRLETVTVTSGGVRLENGSRPDAYVRSARPDVGVRTTNSQMAELDPAADATFAVQLSNESNLRSVVLHYRPLNQTLDWKQVTLKKTADGSFQGTVSSKDILSRDDFQYFVEVLTSDSRGMWPSWNDGPPYVVLRVRRARLQDEAAGSEN